ncbi:MAG TPA: kynureninase [Chryseosolibacter sp.]
MRFEKSIRFARKLDRDDPMASFRKRFLIPRIGGRSAIYFNGNSLGLQPRTAKKFIGEELDDWARLGVEGHVHARRPWIEYHKRSKKLLANLTGARPIEVVAMNQLTVNLHLLMVSFYKPAGRKFRIITEAGAFSSDQYMLESQVKFNGLEPANTLIELRPREGEFCLRTEDIVQAIRTHADELSLILLGGVQYYTGQFFNIGQITAAAHEAGALAGFDLAHAIGNVALTLHKGEVDFAAWCSYKYLNSGPGAIAGIFVHERHARRNDLHRFAGWWGHDEAERFQMKKGFKPMPGADGWQVSNHPVLAGAAHVAALEIFREAGMKNLIRKSKLLTGYLEFILNSIDPRGEHFRLITPSNPDERGCQLSLLMKRNGRTTFGRLLKEGVMADWREPDVIRVAPVPLYNTFQEVFRFGEVFADALRK